MIGAFGTIVITFLVVFAIFFLLREAMLWYWKVNDILNEQKETNNLLRQLLSQNKPGKKVEEDVEIVKSEEVPENAGFLYLYHNIGDKYSVYARIDGENIGDIPYVNDENNIISHSLLKKLSPGEYQVGFYQNVNNKNQVINRISFKMGAKETIIIDPNTGINKI